MGKSLVIVESPAKAKTINKILGAKYIVKASMGHVRDLPKTGFGIEIGGIADPEDAPKKAKGKGKAAAAAAEKAPAKKASAKSKSAAKSTTFEPIYEALAAKKKTIDELKKAAKEADEIYLACDPDREGEAIAWHIAELLKTPKEHTHRVVFHEITAPAIKKAFAAAGEISMDRVNAQQARRVLDRVVGYKLSPLLWSKVLRGLSAGRVQSVAVKLIVEREKEIQAFRPEEFWRITAGLAPQAAAMAMQKFSAELSRWGDAKASMPNETSAREIEAALKAPGTTWKVIDVKAEEKKDNPDPPYRTATLQQHGSIKLRFSAKKTMMLAQQLYEGVEVGEDGPTGLITYMRTDSLNIADEAVDECRKFIVEVLDKEKKLTSAKDVAQSYLSEKPRKFKSEAKGAQEAHEAIRPTSVFRTPESLASALTPDQLKLYRMIWERFVATQMKPAIYTLTTIEVGAAKGVFRATGKTLKYDGHARVTGIKVKDDEAILPNVAAGDALTLEKLDTTQHFTQPPPRYNEASLVKVLEKEGIGRPSTYAQIITTIQTRGYVKKEHRKFFATDIGMIVTDKLVKHFPKILDTEFTSKMETELDEIEEAGRDWQDVLRRFYDPFALDLERAKKEMKHVNDEGAVTEYKCEKCGKPMVEKRNKLGKFLGCSGYPECESAVGLDDEGKPRPKVAAVETEFKCEKCGLPMVKKTGRRGEFLACSGYPKCKNARDITADGKPAAPRKIETEIECDRCQKNKMVVRMGRRGPFLGCGGYPKCKNTRNLTADEAKALGVDTSLLIAAEQAPAPALGPDGKPIEVKCPECGKPMAVKRGFRGQFLACTGYPDCKKTQPLPNEMREKPKPSGEMCDQCGKPMMIRNSKRGPFQGCSGYPECKNAKPLPAGAGGAAAPAAAPARGKRKPAVADDEDGEVEAGAATGEDAEGEA